MTMVDCKTQYIVAEKASSKNVGPLNDAMVRLIKGKILHSITLNRGREFVQFNDSAQLNHIMGNPNFLPPYQLWRRATNENTKGFLHEDFLKRNDFIDIPEKYI